MRAARINVKMVILLIALSLVYIASCAAWSANSLATQAEREMLEKSQILAKQMSAVWEFMDINQDRIDTDSDGTYNFKGIYCAIAGKSIAALFARDTNYEIRYINVNPRKRTALPDDFEAAAFSAFESGVAEYYDTAVYSNMDVFRYVMPVRIKASCLECHGQPKDELDITGYPKEGLAVGDIGGAISIIMPIHLYMSGVEGNITQQVIYLAFLIVIVTVIIFIAIRRLITRPLAQLGTAAEQIESGDLDVDVSGIGASGEIRDLAQQFGSMSRQLKESYETLEDQVKERTMQLASANGALEDQATQLAVANETLDKQRAQLEKANVQLEQTNKRLQDESKYKSDFLAIMSHELRTPLTSILAFTEIWEKTNDGKNGREKAAVGEIKENGQILLQMVNNILESARAEEGRSELHVEMVDVVDLVGTVEGTIGFIAEKRSINFTTYVHPDVPIICADWEKLRRIVENLASNAIKFTQRGGDVRIEVSCADGNRDIVICVSDTGIGIRPEEMPFIFDRFTQSDKSSYRRYSGSGLGLAVVKDLVTMHNGSIEVESDYKQGSTFTVRIPIGDTDWGIMQ